MDLPKIISFLTSELEGHRTDLVSMADLKSLGVIEASLNASGVTDEATHAVAWIAAVIPAVDRGAVRAAYGNDAAALLERLVPIQVLESPPPAVAGRAFGRLLLWVKWAEATRQHDATLRAVGTALLTAEKTKIASPDDRASLRQLLENAIQSASHTETRELLRSLCNDIKAIQEAPPTAAVSRRLLISLSIDIVGSTGAKTKLRKIAADDTWCDQLYRLFYKRFLDEEGRFLDGLFSAGVWGGGPPLDWRRFFMIKGIGDELWMTYDIGTAVSNRTEIDAEIRRAAVRLVDAALSLVARTLFFVATDRDPGPNFDPAVEETIQSEPMDLPFKVTMDLIEDAIEISDLRMGHLAPRAGEYLVADRRSATGRPPLARRPFGADDVEILNRLNAGSFALVGGHRVRQVYRTDLISNDVDRFFRITKEALPGCVMLGENLFRRLEFTPAIEVAPGIGETEMLFAPDPHQPADVVRTAQPVLSMRTEIPAKELKGIEAPYTVHHLITPVGLRKVLHRVTGNKLFKPLLVKRSVNVLREAARFGLPPETNEDEGSGTA